MNTQHTEEELVVLSDILKNHHRLHEQLEHEHVIMREVAAEALLGSVFAGAPVSHDELNEQPYWKKVLHTSGHKLESLDHVNQFENTAYGDVSLDLEDLPLDGKSRVSVIEQRKQCYKDEYARVSQLRNDLIAELELNSDEESSQMLIKDVDHLSGMLEQIEARLEACVGGVDGDPQRMARRLGSMYK